MSKPEWNYLQVRATITQESHGWLSARVMAKPVGSSWTAMHTVASHRWRPAEPPATAEQLLLELSDFLGQDLLFPR